MTERLYYNDSTILDFETKVVEVGEHQGRFYAVLDRSAFYPTSGGQSFDTGTINGVDIVDVIESESGEVWHLAESEIGAVGQSVIGTVNKQRRLGHCQMHTAQHILSAAFDKLFKLTTVSVHLGDEYGAIEFDTTSLTDAQVIEAEELASSIIADNVAIEPIFIDATEVATLPLRKPTDRTGKLRIIRIGQFDHVACGGTHCVTSGGVGLVKIIATEKIRGRIMIKFLAGRLAVSDYRTRFGVTDRLAKSFTCHPFDLGDKISKLSETNRRLRQELTEARKALLPIRSAELAATKTTVGRVTLVVAQLVDADVSAAGRLAAMVAGDIDGLVMLLVGTRLVLASGKETKLHAGELAKTMAARSDLKGGGNQNSAQLGGAVASNFDQYRISLESILINE